LIAESPSGSREYAGPTSDDRREHGVADPVATGPATILASTAGSIPFADSLAWIAIGAFVVAMVLEWYGAVDPARYLAAGAWVVFGVFWLTMVPTTTSR